MMKELKARYKSLTTNQKLVIVGLLLFVGMFYWFQIRPSQIRKKCFSSVTEIRDKLASTYKPLTNSQANNYYRKCFAESGFKPEDLVKE